MSLLLAFLQVDNLASDKWYDIRDLANLSSFHCDLRLGRRPGSRFDSG